MRSAALRLIGAWSIVHLGYRAAVIALPLLALQQTGSAWTVGLVSGAGGLPAITAPWWTGRLQRRLSSARALAALMAGEGLATLVVPAAAGLGALTPTVMVGAGLVVGVLNAVSGPLNASLVALIGDRMDARRGQGGSLTAGTGAARLLALQETAVKISLTVAPLLVLPLVTLVGAAWTVALEGLLTLVGAGLTATMRLSGPRDRSTRRPARVSRLLARHREIGVGWTVRGLGCAGWFAFTLGLTVLGQQQGSGVLLATVGLASYSGAAVAGSALGMVSASSRRPALVNALSWVVGGGGWVVIGLVPSLPVIAVTGAVMGLAVPVGNAATTAMVTRSFAGLERRAALTAQATVVTGSSTLGMLVGGPLIVLIGARASITLAGLVVSTVAAGVSLSEYSRGRRLARSESSGTARKVTHDGQRRRELSRL